ncbi:MAG: Alpha/beta hydrolase family protein [Frankiales bacterium]|nr:Alpha/beta hydrolase family protein [Frankiales bacterium]
MTVALEDRLLGVPIGASKTVDVYSGVARLSGKIWAREVKIAGTRPRTAVFFTHPTSNFLGHYMLEKLAATGVAAIGMCTRYVGNDSALLMENCVLDVGAVVSFLRAEGYEKVIACGNSGGGGLVPLFQSQAEKPTITAAPGGGGPDLTKAGLEPADAVILLNGHPSRALLRTEWLDPSIRDEAKPFDRDPDVDMFNSKNGPAYSEEWMTAYRAAQVERNHRITAWCKATIAEVGDRFGGALDDLPFVVHGTTADPRFFDLSIDANDRAAGTTLWGAPEPANYLPASLGHFNSCHSWLSQWSIEDSNAGAHNLSDVSVPIQVLIGTGDPTVLPSHTKLLTDAISHDDWERVDLPGGTHYFEGQPELTDRVAKEMHRWLDAHDMV